MKAALAKILKDVAKKKIKKKIANASSFFSGEEGITGIVALSAPLIPILIGTVIVIGAIMLPILLTQQYIQDANASEKILFEDLNGLLVLSDWCKPGDTNCEKQATQKYYEELEKIYNKYKEKNVELDVQLITATIFYANTHRNDLFTESDDSTDIEQGNIKLSDIDRLASNMVNGSSIDYDKYRNYLISTYIPNRFSSLYSDRDDKQNAIEEIADAIMGFKNETTSIAINNNYGSLGIDCSTISLKDRNGNISVHELEEYVAGVVSAENQYGIETSKMQAIAARTVAVARCNEVIENSTNVQVYTKPTEAGTKAAEDTKGLILAYNGKPLSKDEIAFASYPQEYWSDKHLNDGFPAWYKRGAKCGAVTCKSGNDGRTWCSTTIFRLPNLEPYTLDMPNTTLTGDYWNNLSLNNQTGHCYGVSQVATRYYESELNYSYEQMIKIFFSDGVQIVSINGSVAEGGTLVAYNNNNYVTRTFQPESGNKHYFSNENSSYAGGFTGQCTWYAFGRANEVLASAGSNLKWTIWSDAGQWYNQNIQMGSNAFEYSSDATKPRPGSIIVWGQKGSWGHVGFVEKVNNDGTLDFTEANIGSARSNSNPYGWQYVANQTYEQIRTRWASAGYYFQGYIYMLK